MSHSLINVDVGNTNNNMNNNGSVTGGSKASIGSLLTEEWMIQPFSTIPSFIEMTFIHDASQSFQYTIKTMIHMIHHYIQNQIRQNTLYNQSNWNNDVDNNNVLFNNEQQSTFLQRIFHRIKNMIQNVRIQTYKSFDQMLHKYNIEVRYIILFWIELICLLSSESARPGEIMYSCRRVKMQPSKTLLLSSSNTTQSKDIKGSTTSSTKPNNNGNIQYKLVPLTTRDKILLSVLVTFGPYIREKLQQLYQRFKNRDNEVSNNNVNISWKQKLLDRFIRYYVCLFPIGNSTIELYTIWCRWNYLKGLSLTYDISSQLLNHLVRRVTQDDKNTISSSQQQSNNKPNTTNNSNTTDEIAISNNNSSVDISTWQKPMIYMVSTITILNWITKLRLEWLEYSQQQRNDQHHPNAVSDKRKLIPPPPQRFSGMTNNSTVHQNLCPLCFRSRIHPTASTSGYVFCLKCIRDYVKEHNTCPVTAIPCPESKLVRLYEPLKSNSLNNLG